MIFLDSLCSLFHPVYNMECKMTLVHSRIQQYQSFHDPTILFDDYKGINKGIEKGTEKGKAMVIDNGRQVMDLKRK